MKKYLKTAKSAFECFNRGEYTRAYNLFGRLAEFNISDSVKIKIVNYQACCLYNVGNVRESSDKIHFLVEEFPGHPLAWFYSGKYWVTANDINLVKYYLGESVKRFPDFIESYSLLAGFLREHELPDAALRVLNKAVRQKYLSRGGGGGGGVSRVDLLAEIADLYFCRGDYSKSLVFLRKCLAVAGRQQFLHYDLMAKCYLKLDNPVKALDSIESYFRYEGMLHVDILVIIARAQCRLDRLHEAHKTFIQVLSLEPDLILQNDDLMDLSPLKKIVSMETCEMNFGMIEIFR